MIIVAAFIISGASTLFKAPVTENASAAEYYVKVGFLQDFSNWNPLNIEFVTDYVACYLMFSVLFQYNESWEGPVNDLATGYSTTTHPSGNMTLTVDITNNAYFRNIADLNDKTHPLTAEDVAFTINLIKDNPGGAWDIYLEDVTGANATGTYQVAIDVRFPKATLIDDLVWIPILPKYMWETEPNVLGAKKPDWLVGSGPFVYNSSLKTQWYRFTKAPSTNYHGSLDYPVGTADPSGPRVVNVDGILYRYYSDVSLMVAAMNSGELDAIDISGAPNLFLNQISSSFQKMVTNEMGIIDIAINAIPMEFRKTTGGGYGQGNPLLLDPYVREAIMMTLNKDFIANTLMFGLPEEAYSVLSTGFWQADIQGKLAYDPAAAKTLLMNHGYADTDSDTYLEATSTALPVVRGWASVGDELNFLLQAPDTDPSYEAIGTNWVGWARDAGIFFDYSTESEAIMTNNAWYKANYDVWVWAWYWSPEPLSNLAVWQTSQMRTGGDNCQMPMGPWYFNEANSSTGVAYSAYDENFTAAQREFDVGARKLLVDKLQQWIYDSRCESPPIYPAGLYVVSNARYTGWGNWSNTVGRSVSSDLPWLWFGLVPKGGNQMPEFTLPLDPTYQFVVNETQSFTITVRDPDGDQINITWNFGDGQTATNQSTGNTLDGVTFTQTHVYQSLAMPPTGLAMNVTANDGIVANTATSYATVFVFPYPDALPELTTPILWYPYIAYVDENVTWTVGARDAETGGGSGVGLTFTWVWDDGTINSTTYMPSTKGGSVMDTQIHLWTLPGAYSVELFVDDGSIWPGHNVSMGVITIEVVLNEAPWPPDVSAIYGLRNVWMDCIATASDVDGDSLKFTWDWGDGTYNVTTSPETGRNVTVFSEVKHVWTTQGTYTVTVWVDDQTGEPGHNVSGTATATIANAGQVSPSSIGLIPAPNPAYPDRDVTFNASAVDANMDALTLYLDYGDGNASSGALPSGTTARQFSDFVHAYEAVGVYYVTLWVDDGTDNVSKTVSLTIIENSPPWLILQSNASASYNRTFTLLPSGVRDNDSDPLSVWFDWGDGKISAGAPPFWNGTHVYEMVGLVNVTVYADDGTGLAGHNVSKTTAVTINENFKPTISGEIVLTPTKTKYKPGETIMFAITVRDYEGDEVNVTVDFGDGTDAVAVPTFRPGPNNLTTVYVNHTFEKGRSSPYTVTVTVDDGMLQFHSVKEWNSRTVQISVEKKSSNTMLYVGIAVAVIAAIAILLAFLLMRRKKEPKEEGGMEGMKPPVEEPSPPKT
jgi:ABC-type transport system substrate-binding protein